MERLAIRLAASALLLALAGAANAQTLKFSTVGSPSDPDTVAMKDWEAYIEENSDLEVDVFDSASLVEQGKQAQALARGTIDAAYMSPTWIAEKIPAWDILATPYLLTGPDHICAFQQSDLWPEMVDEVDEAMGIVLLEAAYQGTRTLNLREQKDVKTPADLSGMTLRVVPSPANILMGEALGASPTPIPFKELYLALQTGTVDAQENPLTLIYSNKFHEVTEQIVNTNHKVLIQMPAFSKRNWEKLSEDQKQVVRDGARRAADNYSKNVAMQEASLRKTMEEEGIVFTDPDIDAFRAAMLESFKGSDLAKGWKPGMFDTIAGMDIPAECNMD
ncbi:TRAP transporter substrate-binding protein DctP [uncultured Nitratireductor sp.]|uniref:TRAP transporter substrate-binding protein DctP n=1 Tax=uncultured Nitratireductor sp. TaxID=520953 RepID=UPI0025F6A767|nr:TRAP transporter substrate-binding protein DctP [uncultured Nitratireductor sp.]